uniref:DDE-1 domain-containing protein n=1 Tax=Pipistrellus kuhlii TaxID=59472 RepID=A0A7J7RL74_PIPKU|nr:hypothetical protein mPipKuh1_010518 [Pipistrellus kuhlii]
MPPVNSSDLSDTVRGEYLHDSTSGYIQPMGQGVASSFKAHYLRRTFELMLEAADGEATATIGEFWRNYSILDAVDNIAVAWEALRPATMNSVWKKIWPQCVQFQNFSQADYIAQLQKPHCDPCQDSVLQSLWKLTEIGKYSHRRMLSLMRSWCSWNRSQQERRRVETTCSASVNHRTLGSPLTC